MPVHICHIRYSLGLTDGDFSCGVQQMSTQTAVTGILASRLAATTKFTTASLWSGQICCNALELLPGPVSHPTRLCAAHVNAGRIHLHASAMQQSRCTFDMYQSTGSLPHTLVGLYLVRHSCCYRYKGLIRADLLQQFAAEKLLKLPHMSAVTSRNHVALLLL